MIENIKRVREPFTWALVVVLLGGLVLGLTRIWLEVGSGMPLPDALQAIGGELMNLTVVFALVGLVCTCLFATPATRNALLVTRVAAAVVSLGALITMVANLVGLWAVPDTLAILMDLLGGLLDLILKVLAAWALWLLARGVKAGRIEPAPAALPADSESGPAQDRAPAVSWRREDAVGRAWGSAAEAASGQPGKDHLEVDAEPGSE